jgi:Family of unknown function (DUF6152)
MPKKLAILLVIVLTVLIIGAPLFAHHGAAAYTDKLTSMKATITEFRFINPHALIFFDIKNDKGEVEHWQGEVTSPNKLARAGWTKYTFKAGEECEISGRAGKNNAHSVWISKIVKSSGETLKLSETID